MAASRLGKLVKAIFPFWNDETPFLSGDKMPGRPFISWVAKVSGQKAFGMVLLGLIALYFALQGREGPWAPPSPSPSSLQEEASPVCQARVWAATLGYQEVRLQLEGPASLIRLAWSGGSLEVETPRVCSGGECRVPIPPGVSPVEVRVDTCPPIRLGE